MLALSKQANLHFVAMVARGWGAAAFVLVKAMLLTTWRFNTRVSCSNRRRQRSCVIRCLPNQKVGSFVSL
jgi:hypothetical protein